VAAPAGDGSVTLAAVTDDDGYSGGDRQVDALVREFGLLSTRDQPW